MRKGFLTKFSAILILFTLFTAPLSAVDLNTYIELAQSGTATDIEAAFKDTPEIKNHTFGDNKETFLIIAIKNNRPLEIISLLIKYGCKVKTKSKDKRTTVMYAAKFNKDPEVLRLLIKECALTNNGRIKFVAQADDSGQTAFDYAKQNDNAASITSVLNDFRDVKKEAKEARQREKEELKKQKEEEAAAKKAEKEAAKAAEKAAKEEEKAAKAAEKEAKKAEKQAAKESENKETEQPAETAEATPVKQEKPVETKPSVPQSRYTNDDFFKEQYSPDDFINSQDGSYTAETQKPSKPNPKENKPSQSKTNELADRLSMNPEISAQPYTKTYLFDYITDNTPEAPEEESTAQASVQIDNVDRQDRNGITLLMKAAKAGNDWDVQNLLANGANVQLRDKDGWTALMYAVRYQNNLSIVKKIIDAGAYVRVRNKFNSTPLLMAANFSQNPEILRLLLKGRTVSEDEVYAAFIVALTSEEGAEHVKKLKIQLFLDMGITVNRMWKGMTPLMYACQYGNSTEVIKLLIDSGARTNIQNQDGKTAFDFAGQNPSLQHDDIYWSLNSIGR